MVDNMAVFQPNAWKANLRSCLDTADHFDYKASWSQKHPTLKTA